MKKTLCLAFILLFTLGSLGWGQDTIKIGVVGPRTGPAAATGKAFEEGISIALDHINAKGGVMGKKVEVIFEDTGGVPEKAASALERLATRDKVPVVVGESHSSSALADRSGQPLQGPPRAGRADGRPGVLQARGRSRGHGSEVGTAMAEGSGREALVARYQPLVRQRTE